MKIPARRVVLVTAAVCLSGACTRAAQTPTPRSERAVLQDFDISVVEAAKAESLASRLEVTGFSTILPVKDPALCRGVAILLSISEALRRRRARLGQMPVYGFICPPSESAAVTAEWGEAFVNHLLPQELDTQVLLRAFDSRPSAAARHPGLTCCRGKINCGPVSSCTVPRSGSISWAWDSSGS
jgi:hypothetical protein